MSLLRRTRYLVAPLLLLSPWGWLELLRTLAVPGPRLVDALPLYEGSRHDTLPAVTVVAVWIVAATLACLPFRPRFPQAAAALLGAAVVVACVAIEGAQLELVRQTQAGIDVGAAAHTFAPWLAGGLCSLVAVVLWCRPEAAQAVEPGGEERQ